jgi:hypothetical protein
VVLYYSIQEVENWSLGQLNLFIKSIDELEKSELQKIRLINFATFQVNSKKPLKLNDIMQFPWENETKETAIVNEVDKGKMMLEIERISKKLNNPK